MAKKSKAEITFRKKAPWIMALLMRDLPKIGLDDAAAILGNFGHESAGFTAMQERRPTVPGSRGGRGWPMFTSSRRRAFEAWCKAHGLDPDGDEANYRYVIVELNGSEKAAIPALKKARGLDAKVKAFERAYERAGVKHYASRNQWAAVAIDAYTGMVDELRIPDWAKPAGRPVEPRPAPEAPKADDDAPRVPAPPAGPKEPEIRPVPVEVPGLDKPLPKSTTFWATIVGLFTSVIGALQAIDWRVTLALIVVAVAAAIWIIQQRRKYAAAQRTIVADARAAQEPL